MVIEKVKKFNSEIMVPSDKSITHRALLFSLLCQGKCIIHNPLISNSTLSTLEILRKVGAHISLEKDVIEIDSTTIPNDLVYDCNDSATLCRLLCGLLCGRVSATLKGSSSLTTRPMGRVCQPLEKLGANIESSDGTLPIYIKKSQLTGTIIELKKPSAQVKSCILLAGLNATGVTIVVEKIRTRNHTELLLKEMGANITTYSQNNDYYTTIDNSPLHPFEITVPGDISSAMYPLALHIICNKPLTIKNVGLNPTRTYILDVLKRMGANIVVKIDGYYGLEPYGTIVLNEDSILKPITILENESPLIIDEYPILSVIAANANGTSVFKGVNELSFKESNRIQSIVYMIKKLGGNIKYFKDQIIIKGKGYLKGGNINSFKDHRIALSGAVALASSKYGGKLDGFDDALISYPHYQELFK